MVTWSLLPFAVNASLNLFISLRSKRLSNVGRAVLGTRKVRGVHARGREKASSRVKLALLAFPYSCTARPKLFKRLLRRPVASYRPHLRQLLRKCKFRDPNIVTFCLLNYASTL